MTIDGELFLVSGSAKNSVRQLLSDLTDMNGLKFSNSNGPVAQLVNTPVVGQLKVDGSNPANSNSLILLIYHVSSQKKCNNDQMK